MINLLTNIEKCNYRDNIGELVNHPDYISLKQKLTTEIKDNEIDVSDCNSILLLDLENVKNNVDIDILKRYDTVYIFYSHYCVKLATEINSQLIKHNIKYVPLMFTEKNGLDHLLSFFLGMLSHKMNNNTEIHIYSEDKGFNNLINYFNLLNISRDIICKRVAPSNENVDDLSRIFNKLSTYPKTKTGLLNHLNNLLRDYNQAQNVLNQLIANNYIKINKNYLVVYIK